MHQYKIEKFNHDLSPSMFQYGISKWYCFIMKKKFHQPLHFITRVNAERVVENNNI
jgi:hypothetical protein